MVNFRRRGRHAQIRSAPFSEENRIGDKSDLCKDRTHERQWRFRRAEINGTRSINPVTGRSAFLHLHRGIKKIHQLLIIPQRASFVKRNLSIFFFPSIVKARQNDKSVRQRVSAAEITPLSRAESRYPHRRISLPRSFFAALTLGAISVHMRLASSSMPSADCNMRFASRSKADSSSSACCFRTKYTSLKYRLSGVRILTICRVVPFISLPPIVFYHVCPPNRRLNTKGRIFSQSHKKNCLPLPIFQIIALTGKKC